MDSLPSLVAPVKTPKRSFTDDRNFSPSGLFIGMISLILLAVVSLACQLITPHNRDEDTSGRVAFQDDFSNPASGWNRVTDSQGASDYADGAYRIFVNEANMDIWARPGLDFTDVRVEVNAFKVGGERDNRFGVICRLKGENFYTFIISSDGYYGIGKIRGQEYGLIGAEAMRRSNAIQLGSALNHIRADCIGDALTLFVNGEKIVQVQDDEFQSGDVGLIVGTYNTPGADIRFDDFAVITP